MVRRFNAIYEYPIRDRTNIKVGGIQLAEIIDGCASLEDAFHKVEQLVKKHSDALGNTITLLALSEIFEPTK